MNYEGVRLPDRRSTLLAGWRVAKRLRRRSRPLGNPRLHRLSVSQHGNSISLTLLTNAELIPTGVVAHSRVLPDHWAQVADLTTAPDRDHTVASSGTIDLRALGTLAATVRSTLTQADGSDVHAVGRPVDSLVNDLSADDLGSDSPDDETGFPDADDYQGGTLQLFIRVQSTASALPRHARQVRPEQASAPTGSDEPPTQTGRQLAEAVTRGAITADSVWSGLIPLGRFVDSDLGELHPVTVGEHTFRMYADARGRFRVAVDRRARPYAAVYVDDLQVYAGQVTFTGQLKSRHGDVSEARLVLIGRSTGRRFESRAPTTLDLPITARRFGLRHYAWGATLDLAGQPLMALAENELVDAWLELTTQDTADPHRARIGRTPYAVRQAVRAGWRERGDKTVALTPYYTFKAKNTSFHVDLLDTDGFRLLGRRTARRRPRRSRSDEKPVWLVGERSYKAQDTGLAFFRFLRREHPEIDAYYVIDRASPEVKNLEGLDHIVWHQSKAHVEVALRAERFIGSHHPDYLFPTRLPQFRKAVKGTKVFLQHGVMGTKWMVPNYGRHIAGFDTDLFIVSSAREKEYIVSDFGYSPDEVAVTGLSRYDTLFAADVPLRPRQVLVIPTWRDWLQDHEQFESSAYLHEWQGLVTDPRLTALTASGEVELVLCLHPNMQQYSSHFAGTGIRVISQGDVDVQFLIKQSAVMVTDYSSVGFDFSFLGKSVIYFQFDRDRFLGRMGSHLDLDRELPGPIGFSRNDTIDLITEAMARGGVADPEHQRRSDRFIDHHDTQNCERIFQAVLSAKPRSAAQRLVDPELRALSFNVFRRSSAYYPTMRRLMALYRMLPMESDVIVFESGLGRQYADSPRYIYEELVRRGDPRRKVWVYPGKLPVTDAHTMTVGRLSPEYYWYLARAKYWVNNQNFPHYVRRRPEGVFIQTWHGTPLKKMQYDLDEIHGRDPGYLDRVTKAMNQWSTLLSPSPYATRAFRSAFRYRGPVLELGYPRNDTLADPLRGGEIRSAVRHHLGLKDDAKAILYAPTFRDDQVGSRKGRFRFDLPFALQDFVDALDDNVLLLVRMHVLIENTITIPEELRARVMDVSSYPDIQELYLASDVLVTDYSSVFFDYAILNRPVVFLAQDLDQYRDLLRGFYLDYSRDLPGTVVTDPRELWDVLGAALHPDDAARERMAEFARTYAPNDDGRAAARVVDALLTEK